MMIFKFIKMIFCRLRGGLNHQANKEAFQWPVQSPTKKTRVRKYLQWAHSKTLLKDFWTIITVRLLTLTSEFDILEPVFVSSGQSWNPKMSSLQESGHGWRVGPQRRLGQSSHPHSLRPLHPLPTYTNKSK